uniref:conjugative transposon protein TraM n=1 Tax=Pedobacter schmidteae TaxID=2201271 RepID=UPI000EB15E35|nr:conjugative transposon protein TraM [Pedobacter schmidteae]
MSKQRARVEKRKLLLCLPLLALPFLAFGFYALGGGNGAAVEKDVVVNGINLDLPDAQFKKSEPSDKMGIYKLMESDTGASGESDGIQAVAGRLGFTPNEDPQTRQINEKLAAINREINQPVTAQKSYEELFKRSSGQTREEPLSKDVSRLESLMKTMQSPSGGDDPEMVQLNSLMDKIIAVQNPELARQKQAGSKVAVVPDSLFKAIPAEIAVKQKAVQGSVVELRLLDTLVVKGQVIPKGHAVFGLAEFSNQRLNLQIRNIRVGNQIIPVNLTVFDRKDAMIGINAPEAVLTDAVNAGSSDAIGGFGIGSFDQSLGVQVAGAGIEAAKNMLTKRLKRVKQPLKAGYPLLLRDNTKKLK